MKVLTIGTFDLLHAGHLAMLERAAEIGELTVGVNSDGFVNEYKGAPYEPYDVRAGHVSCLPYVAGVLENDGPGADLIRELRPSILGQLRYQTRPPDETIAVVSDTPNVPQLREHFPDVTFVEQERRGDWGHQARATGLDLATQGWVGWFNSDDMYVNDYLWKMMGECGGADAVFCDWNERPGNAYFGLYGSTAGNFIIRRVVALDVGWPTDMVAVSGMPPGYANDGRFIDAVVASGATYRKVPELLYWHF